MGWNHQPDDQFFQDYFLIPEEIVEDRSFKGAFTVFFAGLPNRVIRRFQSLPLVWPLNSKKGHRENPCNDARNLTHDLFAGHIGKWAPEMMCLGEIGPLQGRNIWLMEEIRLTSWYGECPHYLKGFIHVRWLALGFLVAIFPVSLSERENKWKIMDSKVPTAPDRLVDRKAMFDVEANHNAANDVWSAGYVSMQHMYNMQIYVHVCM